VAIGPEQLKQIPLFERLSDRDLKSLAGSLIDRTFEAGRMVTEQGGPGVGFFVIEEGSATVTVDGNEVRKLGPGDWFGEIALLTGSPRSATIVADTDLHCQGLTQWEFKPLVDKHQTLAWTLLQTMAQRLAEAQPSAP
jgi:CRP-like cAMP-binding protein